MIKLKNITLIEYLRLEDRAEYDFAITYAHQFKRAVDIFSVGDFTQLEFGLIKDLQYDMERGMLWDKMVECMALLSEQKVDVIYRLTLLDAINFRNFIVESISNIVRVESIALAYSPTEDEINAGIDRLNVYGVYNQLLMVALGDPLKIPEVRKMKYEDAFVFLCNRKDDYEFNRRLMKIRSKAAQ